MSVILLDARQSVAYNKNITNRQHHDTMLTMICQYFLGGFYMFNKDIRAEAKEKGIFLYQIAEKLHTSEATMTRLMRRELDEAKKTQLRAVINELAAARVTAKK